MSATGETTNYGLPLYNGTDYANFFDMNTTNNKLDDVLKSIQTKAETADTKANTNTTAIEQANDSINNNMTAIDGIQTNLTTFQQTLNTQGTRIGNVETSVNGVSATLETVSSEIATNTEDIAELKNIEHIHMLNLTNITGNISDEFTVASGSSTWYIGIMSIYLTTNNGLQTSNKVLDVKNISTSNMPGGITSIITNSNFRGTFGGNWNIKMTYISSVSLNGTNPKLSCTILYT